MPGLHYLDNQSDTQPFAQMGSAIGSIATAAPYMQIQQERLKQQMVLQKAQQILREAQAKQAIAHAGLYQQQTETDKTKQEGMKTTQKSADEAGQAATYSGLVNSNDQQLGPAVDLLRGANILPQQGFDITRGGLVDSLKALERGAMVRNAASSPQSAASLMQGRNVMPGGVAFNALGDQVGKGRTPDIKVGQGQTVYPQGDTENPVFGLAEIPKGGTLMGPSEGGGGLEQYATGLPSVGNQIPLNDFVEREAVKAASHGAATGGPKMAGRAGQAVMDFSTNLPSMKKVQSIPHPVLKDHTPGPTPPPHMRRVGDKVQTQKGIFQWNGQGWEPLANPSTQ